MDSLVKGFWLTLGVLLAIATALFAPSWIASIWARFTSKHESNKRASKAAEVAESN